MNSSQTRSHVPRETIDDIRSRSDIVEVISECGVVLRPAGRDYKGLCPFHDEKTPSFTVSPPKQMFYCFGCQTGGNVFTFVQKHEGKDFRETLEWLASRLNIDLPNPDGRASANRKRVTSLEDLNRFAVEYYHNQLLIDRAGASAMQYLKHRGVQLKTLRSFQLGYAKPGRRDLIKAATDKGFTIQQLIDAGLIKDEDRGPQDRFWNRVLFPIYNERGVPVGFGGRSLSEEHQPKYLNSPATVLYDKSNILYNLDKARQSIYKKQHVLLVEGYMDVLMLAQSGIENVVASSGTSLSENHASLLKRFAPEVIIVYDGDASGFQAAHRGLHRLLSEGLQVRIALLPEGEDPDSFTREHGVTAFTELTDKAINLIEFQIQAENWKMASKKRGTDEDQADSLYSKRSKGTKLHMDKQKSKAQRGVLYIGHVPHGFYERQMKDYFTQFGKVTKLRLARSRKTGGSKGYAFIEFEDRDVASIVAETMNNYLMFDKLLKCEVVHPDKVHPGMFFGRKRFVRSVSERRETTRRYFNKACSMRQYQERVKRLLKRERKTTRKLKELGIEYDFPQYTQIAPKLSRHMKFGDSIDKEEDDSEEQRVAVSQE